MKIIKEFFNFFIDYIFPFRCLSCSEFLTERGVCVKCFNLLEHISHEYACDLCGMNLSFKYEDYLLCDKCFNKKEQFYHTKALSLMRYNTAAKNLVCNFKYHDQLYNAKYFAKLSIMRNYQFFEDIDIITTVPMHYIKRLLRNYNQSAILALELSKKLNKIFIHDLLVKNKLTVSQTVISKNLREKNVKNTINIKKKYIKDLKGKNILIVDDVYTTGSTLNECSMVIKKHSLASNIKLFTISRAY